MVGSGPGLKHVPAVVLTANSLLRLVSVALRALLTLAMAVWLQPSELGLYALIAATLTLTTYFYGLDFQTFSMRELSTNDLAGARVRIRDQFALLLIIYAIGSAILAAVLMQFGLDPGLLAVVVLMAAVQHASLEFYRNLQQAWPAGCRNRHTPDPRFGVGAPEPLDQTAHRRPFASDIARLLADRLGSERDLGGLAAHQLATSFRAAIDRSRVAGIWITNRVEDARRDAGAGSVVHLGSDDIRDLGFP